MSEYCKLQTSVVITVNHLITAEENKNKNKNDLFPNLFRKKSINFPFQRIIRHFFIFSGICFFISGNF